jgi:hypothetical protein
MRLSPDAEAPAGAHGPVRYVAPCTGCKSDLGRGQGDAAMGDLS